MSGDCSVMPGSCMSWVVCGDCIEIYAVVRNGAVVNILIIIHTVRILPVEIITIIIIIIIRRQDIIIIIRMIQVSKMAVLPCVVRKPRHNLLVDGDPMSVQALGAVVVPAVSIPPALIWEEALFVPHPRPHHGGLVVEWWR
jgi:hypothetical protein